MRLDDFSGKDLLNVACTIDITNQELLVDEYTAKHVVDALILLKVQARFYGRLQNLDYLFGVKFFQSLPLRGLKKGEEH